MEAQGLLEQKRLIREILEQAHDLYVEAAEDVEKRRNALALKDNIERLAEILEIEVFGLTVC